MKRQLFDKKQITPTVIQPVAIGGTEANVDTAACETLHMVHEGTVGVSMGVVPLNENLKVPNEFIPGLTTINGDTIQILIPDVYEGHFVEGVAIVSNYDCQRPYLVNTDWGGEGGADASIILQSDIDQGNARFNVQPGTIDFQAPLDVRTVHVSVNNAVFPINVLQGYIEKPSFTVNGDAWSIMDGSIFRNAGITGFGSTPVTYIHGYNQFYITMLMQISSDINFNTILFSASGNNNEYIVDVNNAITLLNGTYYARFKYIGETLESPWSDTASFVIYNVNHPVYEQSVIYGLTVDPDYTYRFGYKLDLSEDGLTLIVGTPDRWGSDPNHGGIVHIFQRSDISWSFSLVSTLTPPTNDAHDHISFGTAVNLADQGNLAFVLCADARMTNNVSDRSRLYVYRTTTRNDASTFALVTSFDLICPDTRFDDNFSSMDVSSDGQTIAIATPGLYVPGSYVPGVSLPQNYVKILKFQTNTLSTVVDIIGALGNDWENATVSLNDLGTRLAIGARYANANGQTNWRGAAYIYDFDGVNWNQTSVLTTSTDSANFGAVITLSGNGNTLAIGDHEQHWSRVIYGPNVDGVIYTYEHDQNAGWVFNEILVPQIPSGQYNTFYITNNYPSDLKLSYDGSLLFVGNPDTDPRDISYHVGSGTIDIFEKSNYGSNQWFYSTILLGSFVPNAARYLGERIAISKDGAVLVGSARYEDQACGAVHIFR